MPSIRNLAAAGLALTATIFPNVAAIPTPAFKTDHEAEPPAALPKNATEEELKWQPAMDFDNDGCYNVPAIDVDGNLSKGLSKRSGKSKGCHDKSDLVNNNVYVRHRCNNGWCAYLYDYYFEKDVAFWGLGGHRHDWEHVVVWVQDGKPKLVSASVHGGYEIRETSQIHWDGTHPKIVYHKGGINTHSFRFGVLKDSKIQNDVGDWFYGDLVSWDGFPSKAIRDKLSEADFGSANFALIDSRFLGHLKKSRGNEAPEFDINIDDD